MPAPKPTTIDAYIAAFDAPVREALEAVRAAARAAAPDATEAIAYGIPTLRLGGNLIHFAGYARHVGLYPGPSGIAAFADELAAYKQGRGSVQLPLDAPMPLDLVRRITAFRAAAARAAAPRRKPPAKQRLPDPPGD